MVLTLLGKQLFCFCQEKVYWTDKKALKNVCHIYTTYLKTTSFLWNVCVCFVILLMLNQLSHIFGKEKLVDNIFREERSKIKIME